MLTYMGYVDVSWYINIYCGNSIPTNMLMDRLIRASMDVDRLTRMKIKKFGGFDNLSEYEQNCVRLAVCAQADYTYTKAYMDGLSSYSIGDVSVNFDTNKEYSTECINHLSLTRLMYRGL